MTDTLPNPLHPLHPLHLQAGAEFQAYADLEIVSTFGEPQAEYSAIHKGCGLLDMPQRGVLELTGRDRLAFLNNLVTNLTWDKAAKGGLAAGQGVYAYYLNAKGRVIADMNVLELGDGRTLVEMDGRMVEPVRKMFDKYLFLEQVTMTNRVGALHEVALLGPGALAVLDAAAEPKLGELAPLGSARVRMFDADVVVYRDDLAGVPAYGLLFDSAEARAVWMTLVSRFGEAAELGKRALRPVGWAAFNATRIEAGRPLFDVDFGNSADPDKSVLPAETGQFDRAVSVTKGCYLGQEIVARMHARQQVAKQLVGLRIEDDSLPMAGAPLFDEGHNQVGVVTSSTVSPVLSNAAICLGYVKRPLFAEGSVLQVPAEGGMRRATVVKTPFVM
ncbi:MAG: tRNA-modifying protein YgfZ [uncultured Phycisphaerae bacterium]|uniref:tRNA-modifying protein YgfZ n=1 Tax=uncultured Phycisphaerae bacterium TaxID=904963 RepID=A0A6J4Q0F8_9BACT|nr:MAG: tRNA-modifying protein YgfZ [uncultured Phycisphaerae bacterium]